MTAHGVDPKNRSTGEPRSAGSGLSRRRFLGWLGVAGVGAAAGAGGVGLADRAAGSSAAAADRTVPFYGPHQAGIATPQQANVVFASLDVTDRSRDDLRGLLRYWTGAAARMTGGRPAVASSAGPTRPPWETGEALGLRPGRLTLTFGVGPTLFSHPGLGLGPLRPAALSELPSFPTDALDPTLVGGDLCIQACADDEQVALHAVRELLRLGHGLVSVRWSQSGFLPRVESGATPRNLLGFKDGTNNIRGDDEAGLRGYVWVGSEGPDWLRGGSYLVARKIEVHVDRWDGSSLAEQEATIGRRKASGAPLGGRFEHDRVDLRATGERALAANAHIRLAAPDTNGGERILRRPYSFMDGAGGQGTLRVGLFFLAYQRDPRRQFIPIQRRLAATDALNEYIRHTASAVFAMFPGVRPGRAFGSGLL